ncbi:MAG: GerMN domain-containing protein [Syntrophaceae bacterium]
MATKKEKKTAERSAKKKKKTAKLIMLVAAGLFGVAIAAFLIFTYSDLVTSPDRGESIAKREKIKASLFFSDSNERFLTAETRFIPKGRNQTEQVAEVVNALIDGPHTDLVRTVPEKSRLINVRVDSNGVAIVNFDSAMIEHHPGGSTSEIATIYSLTNSITRNVPEVKKVKILVDGKELETLKGHIDARYPFAPNMDLVSKQSAG